MLTETVSGKCPCCGYNKLLQRYGSEGYYHLDACMNCGFGYGSDFHKSQVGVKAWRWYAIHMLAQHQSEQYEHLFENDPQVVVEVDGPWEQIIYNGGKTKEDKAYEYAAAKLERLNDLDLRRAMFEWLETTDRSPDVSSTIFSYGEDDIQYHMITEPKIFKIIY